MANVVSEMPIDPVIYMIQTLERKAGRSVSMFFESPIIYALGLAYKDRFLFSVWERGLV